MKQVPGIWKWAVILLLLCNIGLMLTIWLKPGQRGPGGETPRDFVIRNLKFSDEQVQKYDALIKDHRREMNRLRHEAMEYRQALFANLKNEGRGGMNPDSLTQLIASNQKQVELVTYNHFGQVRAICTEEQKKVFDNIIGEVTKKMNGPGHGGPPPHDRQDPPPDREPGDNPPPPPPDGR